MSPQSDDGALVPAEIKRALESNVQLRSALRQTRLPDDFQAMVLGLATFRRINPWRSSCRSGRRDLNDLT